MKNRTILLLVTLLAMNQVMAQGTLIDREGVASFFSEAPMEDIEAVNKEVIGAMNMDKGTLAVSMFMTGFDFEKSLMQEHFNENYLESEKFPKATFKGVIKDFGNYDFSKEGSYDVMVEGEMDIHGVTRPMTTNVQFDVASDKIGANTTFNISIADHDIEIPTLVIKNIAEVVEVKASFNFSK